jgi:hypothetical protein
MKRLALRVCLGLLALLGATDVAVTRAAENPASPAFEFREVEYFHRWSQGNQHEFTPAKQEDLEHWTDMITINGYPGVDDAEKMAGAANAVLAKYQRAQGKILNSRSVPRTDERPAEHFICVRFVRPQFVEIAFARFKLVDNKGHSFVYSHRAYGDEANEQMDEWFKTNRAEVEKALMSWKPPAAVLSRP